MKYEYRGVHPTVCLVGRTLLQINNGDVVELPTPISSDFVLKQPAKKAPSTPLVEKKKEIRHAIGTGTRIVGE